MATLLIYIEGVEQSPTQVNRREIPQFRSDLEACKKELRAHGTFSVFVREGNVFHLIGGEKR